MFLRINSIISNKLRFRRVPDKLESIILIGVYKLHNTFVKTLHKFLSFIIMNCLVGGIRKIFKIQLQNTNLNRKNTIALAIYGDLKFKI